MYHSPDEKNISVCLFYHLICLITSLAIELPERFIPSWLKSVQAKSALHTSEDGENRPHLTFSADFAIGDTQMVVMVVMSTNKQRDPPIWVLVAHASLRRAVTFI